MLLAWLPSRPGVVRFHLLLSRGLECQDGARVRLGVHPYTSRLRFMNDIPDVHKSDFIAWHPPFNLMLYTDRRPRKTVTNQISGKTRTGSSQLDLAVLSAVLPQLVPGDIPISSPRMRTRLFGLAGAATETDRRRRTAAPGRWPLLIPPTLRARFFRRRPSSRSG